MVLHTSTSFLRTGIDCGSTERSGGTYGIYDGYALLVWKNTRQMKVSLQTTFQFSNGIPQSLMAKYLWIRLDRLRHGPRVSRTSSLQPTFVLDFFA
jgi:hypothetical protein